MRIGTSLAILALCVAGSSIAASAAPEQTVTIKSDEARISAQQQFKIAQMFGGARQGGRPAIRGNVMRPRVGGRAPGIRRGVYPRRFRGGVPRVYRAPRVRPRAIYRYPRIGRRPIYRYPRAVRRPIYRYPRVVRRPYYNYPRYRYRRPGFRYYHGGWYYPFAWWLATPRVYFSPRRYAGRCAYWHRRCVGNWGYRTASYYGCMRYHRCR